MVNTQDNAGHRNILSSVEDQVAMVTLNRPAKKNAITSDMWQQISSIFEQIEADPGVRAVIVRGSGNDFCAGADIAEFEDLRRDTSTAKAYEKANDDAFATVRDCRVPVIAAIRGICFGGGFGIAAAADLRIAASDAVFSVPAARLGLAYPALAMADIVNSVGPQVAKYLTFSANSINADQAFEAGFLLEIARDATVENRAQELAATIAQNAPLSVTASKAAIKAVLSGMPGDLERAAALGSKTFESKDYSEGRRAFAEKRKPRFSGK